MNIHVSEFCVSWVSWAGFKFPLAHNWADIFAYLWFVLAWFHCLQLEAQGREQLREADRENIFLETLLSPVFTICISLWFRKKITVLPIHPLHLFSLLRSHRYPPPTPFQQQPWLSLCPQHVTGKPFEKWKASHSKATEPIGCSESWYTVGRCKLAFFRTCWTWASLNPKCTWLQY